MNRDIHQTPAVLERAWYSASIADFLMTESDTVHGRLLRNSGFSVDVTQRNAWLEEVDLLKNSLNGLDGHLFLEFNIPRMGRRIDAVALIGPAVFVMEFKVGAREFHKSAIEQVWDYALDLKNFHEASHRIPIVPILIITEGMPSDFPTPSTDNDGVYRPITIHVKRLRDLIELMAERIGGEHIDHSSWSKSSYKPTPTIIEAARVLYSSHSVEAIARSDAAAKNLSVTSGRLENIVQDAQSAGRKVICFVTGVPGSGKTLVGLNIATKHRAEDEATHAVFLSGNGPLVKVLTEALALDQVSNEKAKGRKLHKGVARGRVKKFIHNVHHFRDDKLEDPAAPFEHVAIFDEAQRAWDAQETGNFMQRKKGVKGFDKSEPEFLISCMDRHSDWAVVVCLVGGGQEIGTGEAGIEEWITAINTKFAHWSMFISPKLTDSEYAAGNVDHLVRERGNTRFDESLHLAVSMRSFRAENVSAFVKALLDCENLAARDAFARLSDRYPIAVTRDLARAKRWVRDHARGTERFGLMASSRAYRLKPHAIDMRVKVDPVAWFLKGRDDPRSSYYLEDAANEFQVQGLEVDWACVTWDGDLRFDGSGWRYHDFVGSRWVNVRAENQRRYLCNAYRVLLTRARQGMVLFVPEGDVEDLTRRPEYYDGTFDYLRGLGIPEL